MDDGAFRIGPILTGLQRAEKLAGDRKIRNIPNGQRHHANPDLLPRLKGRRSETWKRMASGSNRECTEDEPPA